MCAAAPSAKRNARNARHEVDPPPAGGGRCCDEVVTDEGCRGQARGVASPGRPPSSDLAWRGHLLPQPREDDRPLDPAALFADLDDASGLLLAVSGGPDSMALLLLAARLRARLPIHVATVDHGLRPESAGEAALVAALADDLGLPHAILAWDGIKPLTRIQERARAARYALLADHARVIGASHLLTAHHADDQAETVLMRLGRGSGLAGLAGMRRETPLGAGLVLLRPLLDVPKADLVALCRVEGVAFIEDSSNCNPAYARARLRAQSATLAALGLDRPALTRLAWRMGRADAALEAEAARVEAWLSIERDGDGLRVRLASLRHAEREILLRVLRRAIERLAGRPVPRLDRLETLSDAIAEALERGETHRSTLAGLRITLGRDTMVVIVPEAARRRGMAPPRGKPVAVP